MPRRVSYTNHTCTCGSRDFREINNYSEECLACGKVSKILYTSNVNGQNVMTGISENISPQIKQRKSLLAYRMYSGIGDWMMALSVLKMVNIQFPNIDIYLNMVGKTVARRGAGPVMLPDIINQIIDSFDVKIAGKTYFNNPSDHSPDYDYISGHMKYTKSDKEFFVKSMVDNFNINTGLELVYKKGISAKYNGEIATLPTDISKPYILIQSCSKRGNMSRKWKDYGALNMQKICIKLRNSFNLIQIGQKGDFEIEGISRYLSPSLSMLHALMVNSKLFVGLDGMLGVFASYHKVKQYIIYNNPSSYSWTSFPHRTQIDGESMRPNQIAGLICNQENG